MKQWEKPEMKVFDIKMNENIAASGDVDRPKATGMVTIAKGVGENVDTIMTLTYYTDTNMIIETAYEYIPYGTGKIPTGANETALAISNAIDDAGCR